jgi:hypothetical protein
LGRRTIGPRRHGGIGIRLSLPVKLGLPFNQNDFDIREKGPGHHGDSFLSLRR